MKGWRFWLPLVLLWAAAEASLFFLVADVAIGWIALRRGWKAGVVAALVATLGATAGGAALYGWSANDPARVERLLEAGPAVAAGAVAEAGRELGGGDSRAAMLHAAFSGKPYRLYAAAAPRSGMSLGELATVTPLVRAPRFLLFALALAGVGAVLRRRLERRILAAIYIGAWLVFYAAYWTLTPW